MQITSQRPSDVIPYTCQSEVVNARSGSFYLGHGALRQVTGDRGSPDAAGIGNVLVTRS